MARGARDATTRCLAMARCQDGKEGQDRDGEHEEAAESKVPEKARPGNALTLRLNEALRGQEAERIPPADGTLAGPKRTLLVMPWEEDHGEPPQLKNEGGKEFDCYHKRTRDPV